MGANSLSDRLAFLLADHGIKDSRGLLQDLRELEEKLEQVEVILTSDIVAPADRAYMVRKTLYGE